MLVFGVIAISYGLALMLSSIPAFLSSAARVVGTSDLKDASCDAPRREETVFRLFPSLLQLFALVLISACALIAVKAGASVQSNLLWALVAAIGQAVLIVTWLTHENDGAFIDYRFEFPSLLHPGGSLSTPSGRMIEGDLRELLAMLPVYPLASFAAEVTHGNPGSALLAVGLSLPILIVVPFYYRPPDLPTALGTIAVAGTVIFMVYATYLLFFSARHFSRRHTPDAFILAHLDAKTYHRHLFRLGILWGLPYTASLYMAPIAVLHVMYQNPQSSRLLWLGLLASTAGIIISFLITWGLHVLTNRRAVAHRERLPRSDA